MKVKEHYSGKLSVKFWNAVRKIKNEADHQEIYSLGCALQNFEGYVLKRLKDIIEE